MTAPVRTVSNTSNAQGATSLNVTQLCQTKTPKEVLKAIEQGALPDAQTLVEACKKLQAARQRCGSFDPSSDYVSDEVCADFYSWLGVVQTLIKHKAPITEEARGQVYTIGHGLPQLIEQKESPKRYIVRVSERLRSKVAKKIERIKFAAEVFPVLIKKGLSKFGITKFDPFRDGIK